MCLARLEKLSADCGRATEALRLWGGSEGLSEGNDLRVSFCMPTLKQKGHNIDPKLGIGRRRSISEAAKPFFVCAVPVCEPRQHHSRAAQSDPGKGTGSRGARGPPAHVVA